MLPFLENRNLKIKAILRFHLTPVRRATIKKTTTSNCKLGYSDKRILLDFLVVELQISPAILKVYIEKFHKAKSKSSLQSIFCKGVVF